MLGFCDGSKRIPLPNPPPFQNCSIPELQGPVHWNPNTLGCGARPRLVASCCNHWGLLLDGSWEGGGASLRHVGCQWRLSPGKLVTSIGAISQCAWWGLWGDEGYPWGEGKVSMGKIASMGKNIHGMRDIYGVKDIWGVKGIHGGKNIHGVKNIPRRERHPWGEEHPWDEEHVG